MKRRHSLFFVQKVTNEKTVFATKFLTSAVEFLFDLNSYANPNLSRLEYFKN